MTIEFASARTLLEKHATFVRKTFGDDDQPMRNLSIFIVLYFLLEAVSFAAGKTGGDKDTTEILLYTQYWDWGYGGSQPPLYVWLANAITGVFGLSLLSLSVLKFTMLAIAFIFVMIAARKLGLGALAGAAATFGIFVIPEIGWEAQDRYSHSTAMLAFCAIGLVAVIDARRSGSVWAYLWLGIAWGGAVLSKYNGMVFFVAMALAGVVLPPWRATLLNWKAGLSLLACAVLVAPHAVWALDNWGSVTQRVSKFKFGDSGGGVYDRLLGLSSFLSSGFNLLVFLLAIVGLTLIAYPKLRRAIALPRRDAAASLPAYMVMIALLLILIGVLLSGATTVHNRWLLPAVFLVPMAIAVAASKASAASAGLSRCDPDRDRLNVNVASVGFACAILAAVALPLDTLLTSYSRPKPSKLDYHSFLVELDGSDGEPVGTVVATQYERFANLRLVRPQLKVISPLLPDPESNLSPPTAIIWNGKGRASADLAALVSRLGVSANGLERSTARLVRTDRPEIGLEVEYSVVPAR